MEESAFRQRSFANMPYGLETKKLYSQACPKLRLKKLCPADREEKTVLLIARRLAIICAGCIHLHGNNFHSFLVLSVYQKILNGKQL